MTFFRVDDGMWGADEFDSVSLAAVGLWSKAGSWCARYLKDGSVPLARVAKLGGTIELAFELVAAGIWSTSEAGFQFVSWEEHQDTKAEVESRRLRQRNEKRSQRSRALPKPLGNPEMSSTESATESGAESGAESRRGEERNTDQDLGSLGETLGDLGTQTREADNDAMSLSEAKHRAARGTLRVEFSRRFQAAERNGWTQSSSPALDVLASWLIGMPDPTAAMHKMLDGFFADPWCRSQHFPITHLGKYPQKYFEPRVAAVRDVTRGVFKPMPGDFRKWAPGEYENYIDNIFGDAPKAAAE